MSRGRNTELRIGRPIGRRGWMVALAAAVAAACPHAAYGAYSVANTFDLNAGNSGLTGGTCEAVSGSYQAGIGNPVNDGHDHATLWPGVASTAYDVNPSGFLFSSIAGMSGGQEVGHGGPSFMAIHALLWTGTSSSPVDLNPTGYSESEATAVAHGQQVGYGNGTSGGGHALLWTGTAASAVDLSPASGFMDTSAFATDGTRQGGNGFGTATSNQYHAMLWNGTASSYVDLNPTALGYNLSQVNGMSGGLQVGFGDNASVQHALLWRGTAATVTDLNPSGYTACEAFATNNSQQVGYGKISDISHALVWTQSALIYQDLQSLVPGSPLASVANSIDAYGNIGGSATTTQAVHAVVWYAGDVYLGATSTWTSASNWTSGVPASGTDVEIVPYSQTPVTLNARNGGPALGILTIDNSGGSSVTLNVTTSTLNTANDIIGVVGQGILSQSGGTHTITNTLSMGEQAGSVGSYNFSSGQLFVANENVGDTGGTGSVTQSGGRNTATSSLVLGRVGGAVGVYTLSGPGRLDAGLEIIGGQGSGTLTQTGGVNSVSNDLSLGAGGNGTYTLSSAASSADIQGNMYVGGNFLSPVGQGTLGISGGTLEIDGTLFLRDSLGNAVNLSGGTMSVGALDTAGNPARLNWTNGTLEFTNSNPTIGSGTALGAAVSLTPGKTLRVNSLTGGTLVVRVLSSGAITFAGGQVDVNDQKLISSSDSVGPLVGTWNGSAYTGLTGQIVSGRNGGNWNGPGIITSQSAALNSNYTTLAIATALDVKPSTATATALWSGQTITGTDTLVMYTYGGDATLDGKINVDDYIRIDSGIAAGLTGWSNGDFNYDGKVNIDDYTQFIDANIGTQGAPFSTTGGIDAARAVPESAGGTLAFVFALFRQRRRR